MVTERSISGRIGVIRTPIVPLIWHRSYPPTRFPGLMLFSSHERAPEDGLSDAQEYLGESYLRNTQRVAHAAGNDVEPVVTWTNEPAFVETLGRRESRTFRSTSLLIHATMRRTATMAPGADPSGRATSALLPTFNPETVLEFSKYASEERHGSARMR